MENNKIVMIDYGASNIRSAQKAFEHVGASITLTDEPQMVRQARKLVLPGVGAFGAGMEALRTRGLDSAIIERVSEGVPLLGICLGMQFLFNYSDEMGQHAGLGLIPGKVKRFDIAKYGLKVPHMGWNQIEQSEDHILLDGVLDGAFTYFVHSYYCVPNDAADTIAVTRHGHSFSSIVAREHIYGIQFHPEKSQASGLKILRNFVELI